MIIRESTPKDIGERDAQQQQSNKQHNQNDANSTLCLLCTVLTSLVSLLLLASTRTPTKKFGNDDSRLGGCKYNNDNRRHATQEINLAPKAIVDTNDDNDTEIDNDELTSLNGLQNNNTSNDTINNIPVIHGEEDKYKYLFLVSSITLNAGFDDIVSD